MRRYLVIAMAAVCLVGGAAGCGGDDDDSAGSAEGTTQESSAEPEATAAAKREYITQADEICADLNKQAVGLLDSKTLEELSQNVQKSEELAEKGNEQLGRLEAPTPELAAGMDRFIAAVEDQTALVSEIGDAAQAEDPDAIKKLVPELEQARERKSEIAGELGFKQCGTG